MSAIAERYRRLAARFADTVAAVPADRWSSPTPCEGWTSRDLLAHVVESQGTFLGLVGRDVGDVGSVEDDPVGTFRAAAASVQADLDDPERAGTTFQGRWGETRFDEAVDRFLCFDLVVHRWDLARATGLDERIPAEDVARATAIADGLGDTLQESGASGPPLDPPAGADAQTVLLARLGRRAW